MRHFLLFLLIGTCLSLAYVQQRVSLLTEGYQVERLRHQKDDLLDQHRVLHYNVFTLKSPVVLEQRLGRQDVQLAPPREVQVLMPPVEGYPVVPPGAVFVKGGGFTWLQQARGLAARWLGTSYQAEAQPVREN